MDSAVALMSEPMRPVPMMMVLSNDICLLKCCQKSGTGVVCHGHERHTIVKVEQAHLAQGLFDGNGIDLAKERLNERLTGDLNLSRRSALPSRYAWHISRTSAGWTSAQTLMVPEAPRLISGTVRASSPEYMRNSSDRRCAMLAANATLPLASLMPMTLGWAPSARRCAC